jgi:hypothetical protein
MERNLYQEYVGKRRDARDSHIESVAEELRLNGFQVRVEEEFIVCDTVAGEVKYSCQNIPNIMADFYGFITIYGTKLSVYGRDKRIEARETFEKLENGK